MWVYSKADALARSKLLPAEGFFLDYWLFLFADFSYKVLTSPPINLCDISNIAHMCIAYHNANFITALSDHVNKYKCLSTFTPPSDDAHEKCGCDNPSVCEKDTSNRSKKNGRTSCYVWTDEWKIFLKSFEDSRAQTTIIDEIVNQLAEAIKKNDYDKIANLTTLLASNNPQSERASVQIAKQVFLNNSSNIPIKEKLKALAPTNENEYIVRFQVGRVAIPNNLIKKLARIRPIVEYEGVWPPASNDADAVKYLTGMEVDVTATHPENAAEIALLKCQESVHQLRVKNYIRTHIIGAIKLRIIGENNEIWLSLPQPFWKKKAGGSREIPNFKSIIKIIRFPYRTKWEAARFHISQAIAEWPEDAHSAATDVCQALESYAGSKREAIDGLAGKYSSIFPAIFKKFIASRIHRQNVLFQNIGLGNRWYCYGTRSDFKIWLGRVVSPESTYYFDKWRPYAPHIAFNSIVGLINPNNITLGKSRLEGDIKNNINLIFGIRNAIAHRGEKVGPVKWARYLARLGLEILLEAMNEDANKISDVDKNINTLVQLEKDYYKANNVFTNSISAVAFNPSANVQVDVALPDKNGKNKVIIKGGHNDFVNEILIEKELSRKSVESSEKQEFVSKYLAI